MNVVDLYAGVGGLSLGAARAGFQLAAAVELDQRAIRSHAINFPRARHLNCDVGTLGGGELLDLSGLRRGELAGLIGGPPCQGFSAIGLRTVTDVRNDLLVHFFRLVAEAEPVFFLAENVPGLLSPTNSELLTRALAQIPKEYKLLQPISITASDFGAPTSRRRIFFIGFDPSRMRAIDEDQFNPRVKNEVRVVDALQGLPAIRSNWLTEEQGWRRADAPLHGSFKSKIAADVPSGVGDPTALELYRTKRLVSGFLGTVHTAETIKRFRGLRQGARDPVSKAVRLDPNGYCPTLRAGTGPERGSFQAVRPVHPTSPRVISPREAARLQGFPDWFQFDATKWHSFRQIGNSVSPIVAEAVLRVLAKALS